MLYSQNRDLFEACIDGNVSRVSELLTRGAHVNYRLSGPNVSIVSGHMMLVTDPHISIYYSQWLSIWFCMSVSVSIIDYMYCTCMHES